LLPLLQPRLQAGPSAADAGAGVDEAYEAAQRLGRGVGWASLVRLSSAVRVLSGGRAAVRLRRWAGGISMIIVGVTSQPSLRRLLLVIRLCVLCALRAGK